jgi:hypothetical protein
MALTLIRCRPSSFHRLDQHGHAGLADAVVGLSGDEPVVQRGDEQDRPPRPSQALRRALLVVDERLDQSVGEQPRAPQVGAEHQVEL